MQGQDRTLRTAVPGKGPNHSGDQTPTSQCGHQALYPSWGGQHVDALFTGQIPTKVIIGLLTNEAFDGVWQKNPFNFAHMDLHSDSRVVDGRPLLAQPWQQDFMQGLYAEFYHAVLKSNGMYPSDWSIGMSANHFECGCMLLSCMGPAVRWQLHCGLLIPQMSGHRETSLRFARPLHATTTMIAYAQCDKLVVVDATTHWPLATACDVRLTTSGGPRERAPGS